MIFQELVIQKLKEYYKALSSDTATTISESYIAFLITGDNPLRWHGRLMEDLRLYARQPVNEEQIKIGVFDEDFKQAFAKYEPAKLLHRFPVGPKKPKVFSIFTNVAGITHHSMTVNLAKEERIRMFHLMPEVTSQYPHAVMILADTSKGRLRIGYVPAKVNEDDYMPRNKRVWLHIMANDVITCHAAGSGFTGGTEDKENVGLNLEIKIATVI